MQIPRAGLTLRKLCVLESGLNEIAVLRQVKHAVVVLASIFLPVRHHRTRQVVVLTLRLHTVQVLS